MALDQTRSGYLWEHAKKLGARDHRVQCIFGFRVCRFEWVVLAGSRIGLANAFVYFRWFENSQACWWLVGNNCI